MRALTSRTAALAGAIVVSLAAGAGAAGAQAQRAATGSRFALEIPSLNVGLPINTFEGGNLVAEVVAEPGQKGGKRVVGTRVAPIVLAASPTLIMPLLKAAIDGVPLDGRFVEADFNYKAQSAIEFRQAVATRIAFGSLDGSSREPCSVQITLVPATVALAKADGGDIRGKIGPKQKPCLRSSFMVRLGNLPTSRVAAVDSIVVSRPGAAGPVALERPMASMRKGPDTPGGEAEVSNVTLTVSQADVAAYQQWHDDFLVKGNNGAANELTLDVVYLGPDMKEELFTLRGSGVGLVAMRRSFEVNSERIARFQVELYVERWELVPGSATVSSTQ